MWRSSEEKTGREWRCVCGGDWDRKNERGMKQREGERERYE